MNTVRDLITQALQDLGILAQGEAPSASDADFCVKRLARIIDNWNAEGAAVYAVRFDRFAFTPGLSPHTIGPTGTFVVAQRPVSIESAHVVLNNVSPEVFTPIEVHTDPQWYDSLPTPALESSYPTGVFYNPTWPNGELYFWPVPNQAWDLELRSRIVLSELGLNDSISQPPGYGDALTLTLAEKLLPGFPTVHPNTAQAVIAQAREARARVFRNNDRTPRISTVDSGIPNHAASGGFFNYRNGQPYGR